MIEDAARALRNADVVAVFCGSGSGLLPCGEALCQDNMYADLCMSRPCDFGKNVALENPALFYGFWGRLYNMSIDAEGGALVKFLENLRDRVNATQIVKSIDGELPSFFLYSQAYDAVVSEALGGDAGCYVHGSIRFWQCSEQCTSRVWRLPEDHRFTIHSASLTCKPQEVATPARPPQLLDHYNNQTDSSEPSDHPPFNPATGYPQCPLCQKPAVPNVMDMGLNVCADQAFSAMNYVAWRMAVEEVWGNGEKKVKKKPVVGEPQGCSSDLPRCPWKAQSRV